MTAAVIVWLLAADVSASPQAAGARSDATGVASGSGVCEEEAAATHFLAGRYQAALDCFAHLYAKTGDPIFLRNVARCHQKLAHPRDAIAFFRKYLETDDLSADERGEITRYIGEMEALGKRQAVPDVMAATAATPVALTRTDRTTEASRLGSTPDKMAYLIGLAGVASLGAGVYFSLQTHALGESVGSAAKFDASADGQGQRDARLQFVMYGVGAVALAAAGAIYFGSRPRVAATSAVAYASMLGGGAVGAAVSGRF